MKTETRAVENELLDEAPDGKQLKVLTHKLITHGRDTGDDPDTQNISTSRYQSQFLIEHQAV